jgi:hypothetical protein
MSRSRSSVQLTVDHVMPRSEIVLYSCHRAIQLYDQVAWGRINYESKYSTDASTIDASSRWANQVPCKVGYPRDPFKWTAKRRENSECTNDCGPEAQTTSDRLPQRKPTSDQMMNF